MADIVIKTLSASDIDSEMLMDFKHRQIISKKWVHTEAGWELTDSYDIAEWSAKKRKWIASYLCGHIERGGYVIGAFCGDVIVGFCSVDGELSGNTAKYANLTMLFVDDDWQRRGIGKKLFAAICDCAIALNADKLFISAVPSYETVAFYFCVGCSDAEETIPEFVDTEEDRYLEYDLKKAPAL